MATFMHPSSMDTSIQNRDDIRIRGGYENRPVMLGASQTAIPAEGMIVGQRRKKRDMSIPFMILVLMDFMIILLLWIVYEAVSGVH